MTGNEDLVLSNNCSDTMSRSTKVENTYEYPIRVTGGRGILSEKCDQPAFPASVWNTNRRVGHRIAVLSLLGLSKDLLSQQNYPLKPSSLSRLPLSSGHGQTPGCAFQNPTTVIRKLPNDNLLSTDLKLLYACLQSCRSSFVLVQQMVSSE